jgi:hypothetical protein
LEGITMEIKVRKNSTYFDVSIASGDASIDIGLLDSDEAMELAKKFIGVAEELLPSYQCDLAASVLQSVRENL